MQDNIIFADQIEKYMKNIIEALNWRYAVKKFDTKKIPQEKLDTILESIRLTPSSFGLQTWKFILVSNQEIREQLLSASWNQRQVAEASHLLVLARVNEVTDADTDKWANFLADKQGMPIDKKTAYADMIKGYLNNTPKDAKDIWLEKQLYIVLGNLMNTCALEEIDSCPMEGFDKNRYDEILGLGALGLKSVLVCPIGYRAVDDPYQHLAKARYPMEELVLEI